MSRQATRGFVVAAISAFALSVNPATGWADGGRLGLGLVIGQPTGASAQLRLDGPGLGSALNIAVGLDVFDDFELYGHVDYVVVLGTLMRTRGYQLPLYLGVGAFAVAGADPEAGLRAPLGIQLELDAAPVHAFVEIAIELEIVDGPDVGLGGAIGARYFF